MDATPIGEYQSRRRHREARPPLFLDSAWLRRHYGLGPAEIDRAWRHLPTYRIGDGRKVKVRRDELEAWLEGFRRTPRERVA